MAEKIYVGQAKAIPTQYGTMLKVSFSKKDIDTLIENINERGYVNLNIGERREINEYGHTHSVSIDTWKPDASKAKDQPNHKRVPKQEDIDIDDIPF